MSGEDSLFRPEEYAEPGGVDGATSEHAGLPRPVTAERVPSLTFSCETAEDRLELLAVLNVHREPSGGRNWTVWWPEPPDHGMTPLFDD